MSDQSTTLPSLVDRLKELEAQEKAAIDEGCEVSEAAYWEKEICQKLLAGKIDSAVELKMGVEARMEALKLALRNTQELYDKLEFAFIEALSATPSKRLDGEAWNAKLQTNSKGSVIIDDPSIIPAEFRKYDVCLNSKFQASNVKERRFWTSVILKKPIKEEDLNRLSPEDQVKLDESMTEVFSKADIEIALKQNPIAVPGARLHKGHHLRIGKGDSKGKLLPKE
jgi:hypothetical protein